MDDCKNENPNPKPDPRPAAAREAPANGREEAAEETASRTASDVGEEEFVDDGDANEVEEEEEDEDFDNVEEFDARARNPRTPFTSMNQVDADMALARTLQEQERAYMMLRMGGGGVRRDSAGSETGSEYELQYEDGGVEEDHVQDQGSINGSDYEEDAFDAQESADVDPSAFDDDESFARALQDAEEREMAARLMVFAGINDWVSEDARDYGDNSQDVWSNVDPDELSYEELVALGEAVGTANRGLAADTIALLPSVSYKAENDREESSDQCVICRVEYEDSESLVLLSCKHMYHADCINNWLQINKVCPICNAEVST